MGYEARNRLNDLRGAPMEGRASGHGPAGQQMVKFDFAVLASQVLNRLAPETPTLYLEAQGAEPVAVSMPDYAQMQLQYRAAIDKVHADGTPWTDLETD